MKRQLKILGTGCHKCQLLVDHVERAAMELGIDYEIEKVSALDDILEFGVVATPALLVDGEIRVVGRVPSTPRLKKILGMKEVES